MCCKNDVIVKGFYHRVDKGFMIHSKHREDIDTLNHPIEPAFLFWSE